MGENVECVSRDRPTKRSRLVLLTFSIHFPWSDLENMEYQRTIMHLKAPDVLRYWFVDRMPGAGKAKMPCLCHGARVNEHPHLWSAALNHDTQWLSRNWQIESGAEDNASSSIRHSGQPNVSSPPR